jgi:threonine dehydrogenase-like Zn-dependent dehydrogenase
LYARTPNLLSKRSHSIGSLRIIALLAMTIAPGIAGTARLENMPEPPASDGSILVRTIALGVCGTDREIASGQYGAAPPGESRLILGHESLGRVMTAPAGSAFAPGDLVVGIVRRPDPVPCVACAAGQWDMCRNGLYSERGIKQRHGFGAEQFRIEPDFAVKIDPALGLLGVLMEPTSIVAKAWDHLERIGHRTGVWQPRTVLITGAGPIGLLAAMMGQQRVLEVHVFDHNRGGAKPRLVAELGGTYHTNLAETYGRIQPDIIIECTGAPTVIADVLGRTAPSGLVCLAGVSPPGHVLGLDIGRINRTSVLDNIVVFGTVNANRAHYEMAAEALARANHGWLKGLITRHVPLDRWTEALEGQQGDIKVVIDFPS